MANKYYRYLKTQRTHLQTRFIDLLAVEANGDNDIQLEIGVIRRDGEETNTQYISLTEDEQNDLIIGILERRKVPAHITRSWLKNHASSPYRGDGVVEIEATNTEKSLIHPPIN